MDYHWSPGRNSPACPASTDLAGAGGRGVMGFPMLEMRHRRINDLAATSAGVLVGRAYERDFICSRDCLPSARLSFQALNLTDMLRILWLSASDISDTKRCFEARTLRR